MKIWPSQLQLFRRKVLRPEELLHMVMLALDFWIRKKIAMEMICDLPHRPSKESEHSENQNSSNPE
jgi:hypothetical protein